MLYKISRGKKKQEKIRKQPSPLGICSPSWEKTSAIHQAVCRCLRGFSLLKGHSVKTTFSNPPAWIFFFCLFVFWNNIASNWTNLLATYLHKTQLGWSWCLVYQTPFLMARVCVFLRSACSPLKMPRSLLIIHLDRLFHAVTFRLLNLWSSRVLLRLPCEWSEVVSPTEESLEKGKKIEHPRPKDKSDISTMTR